MMSADHERGCIVAETVVRWRHGPDPDQRPRHRAPVVLARSADGLLPQRMAVAKRLWDAGIKAEFSWKVKPKLPQQFKAAEDNGVPFAIILGDEELAAGKCKIKEMGLPDGHPEKDGVLVEMANLEQEVQNRISGSTAPATEAISGGVEQMSVNEVAKHQSTTS